MPRAKQSLVFKATCRASSYVPHHAAHTYKLQASNSRAHGPLTIHKFPRALGLDGISHEMNAHETGFAVFGSELTCSLGSGFNTKQDDESKDQ